MQPAKKLQEIINRIFDQPHDPHLNLLQNSAWA